MYLNTYFNDLGVHKISTPLIPLKELPKGFGSACLLKKSEFLSVCVEVQNSLHSSLSFLRRIFIIEHIFVFSVYTVHFFKK